MSDKKEIFFDIDGTLYPIEGSFFDSPLNSEIEKRTFFYISKNLKTSGSRAEEIFQSLKVKYPKLYSFGLEKEYGLSRKEYLNFAWDVDPSDVVPQQEWIAPLMSRLQKRDNLYIMSDAPSTWISNILGYFQINQYFKRVFSGGDTKLKKKTGLFDYVISELGVNPNNCIMIGDEKNTDILPARAARMKTVHVGQDNCSDADYNIRSLPELEELLRWI